MQKKHARPKIMKGIIHHGECGGYRENSAKHEGF